MYKKLRAWMEPRYTKIAIYTIVSSIIIFICCLILINSNAALSRFWGLALAILQPLVLGLVIAYLLLPLVRKLETKVFGGFKSKRVRRNLAVLLIYLIIAAALAAGLTVLIISITKTVASIRLADLQSLAAYLQNEFADFWKVIEQKLAEYDVNLGTVGKKAAGMFTNAKSAGSTILFAMIFSIYFLLDSGINKYWTKVSHVLLKDDTRAKAKEFLRDADR
ncbi:MAG: AI-2E family transporter, partial [Lentisphaeria bacterium]|nr:AI-2E family transporter [Lentisphaeria bacterium]